MVLVGIYEKFTKAFSNDVQDNKVGNGLLEGVAEVMNYLDKCKLPNYP